MVVIVGAAILCVDVFDRSANDADVVDAIGCKLILVPLLPSASVDSFPTLVTVLGNGDGFRTIAALATIDCCLSNNESLPFKSAGC